MKNLIIVKFLKIRGVPRKLDESKLAWRRILLSGLQGNIVRISEEVRPETPDTKDL